MRVPVIESTISDKHIAQNYENTHLNADSAGLSVLEAKNKFSGAVAAEIQKREEEFNRTKTVDLTNALDKYYIDTLENKDNGYLYKTGQNAMGQTESLMQNYDDYAAELLKNSGLRGKYLDSAKASIMAKRNRYEIVVNRHEAEQTQNWQNGVYTEKLNNILNQGIFDRNDDALLAENLRQGYNAITLQADMQKWDSDTTEAAKKRFASSFHVEVLKGLIADNNPRANDYYNAHKEEISPEAQNNILNAVKNFDLKYNSRSLADEYILTSKDEEEAIKKAESISDIDLSDATSQRIRQKFSEQRRIENQRQADLIDNFYNNAVTKIKNGGTLTIDDLPEGLNGKNYLNAKNALEELNKRGDITTDGETYSSLWYTATYDAQRFKTMNLAQYRISLSEKDYKELLKRQQDIQKGDYYTILTNNSSTQNYIEQVSGLDGGKIRIFNQYQNMLRSHEERMGRKATDLEKEEMLKYLGSDKNTYKTIEKGMKYNADFHRDLANKISYYQANHNNDMPPADMVQKWIKEQTVQYSNKKYTATLNYAKANVKPHPNEQITLTNFADNYVPALSKQIGANLKVSSRFRPANGRYTSRHSEGRALDISYLTTDNKLLTQKQKIALVGNVLQSPTVEKIAISSADADGKAILQAYGRKYASKIQDMNAIDKNGKSRDTNLGTNHTTHLHITLYNDKTYYGNDKIALKNQLKQRGYSDEKISKFLANEGIM